MTIATLPTVLSDDEAKATFLAAMAEGKELTGKEVGNLIGKTRKTGDSRKKAWQADGKVLAAHTPKAERLPAPVVDVAPTPVPVEPVEPLEAAVEPPTQRSEGVEPLPRRRSS